MNADEDGFGFQLPEDEASRDRLAELGQLAGALVHEIKNPLGAIDLNAELASGQLAQEEIDRDKLARRLERIRLSSRHLQDIVESYLAYARPGRPDRDRIDLNAILAEIIEEHAEVFAAAATKVVFRPDDDLLAVPADPGHLRSAFLNILLNGVDALAQRTEDRSLIVATRNRTESVVVVIANNGPPLSSNAAAHLFDPFYSEKEEGTGLGLAIVRRLVELHNGRVAVHSDPQQGVSFTIELPTNLGPVKGRIPLPIAAKEVEAMVRAAET